MWAILVFTIIILLILFYYNWIIGIVMTVLAAIVYFMAKREQEQLDQLYRSHMNQLSYQVEQSGRQLFYKCQLESLFIMMISILNGQILIWKHYVKKKT